MGREIARMRTQKGRTDAHGAADLNRHPFRLYHSRDARKDMASPRRAGHRQRTSSVNQSRGAKPRIELSSYRSRFFEPLEERLLLTADTWVGGSGDWSNAAHWSAGVPTTTSAVTIIPGVTVTVSTGTQMANTITTDATDTLSITGGTLTIGAPLTIAGNLNLGGGSLTSEFTLTLGGANNVWTSGTIAGSIAGKGSGTVSLASGTLFIGAGGATFDFPGNMFQWSGGAIDSFGGGGQLTNSGVITIGGAGAKTLVGLVLNNSDKIVEAGTSGTSDWQFEFGSVLDNLGGTVDMTTSESIANIGINDINNERGGAIREHRQ